LNILMLGNEISRLTLGIEGYLRGVI